MPAAIVYPAPRFDRGTPVPTVSGQTPASIPRTRLLPWAITLAANQRDTVVFGPFTGPGYLDEFIWSTMSWPSAAARVGVLQVIVSEDNTGAGDNVGLPPPSGTVVWDNVGESTGLNQDALSGGGIPHQFAMTSPDHRRIKLGVPVQSSRFFVKVSMLNGSAASGVETQGSIRLLEQLTPEQLENLALAA